MEKLKDNLKILAVIAFIVAICLYLSFLHGVNRIRKHQHGRTFLVINNTVNNNAMERKTIQLDRETSKIMLDMYDFLNRVSVYIKADLDHPDAIQRRESEKFYEDQWT